MIYSEDHKFLLIKNMKVGSTSIEVELSKILPQNAIVTLINPPNKNHKPRNFNNFKNHESFLSASNKINLEGVSSYTFIRNPYECVLSDFFFRPEITKLSKFWNKMLKQDKNNLINDYFLGKLTYGPFLRSTKNLYTDGNNILVTKLLRYENGLESEINKILPLHNLPRIQINTFEKAYRPKNVLYNDIFTKTHIQQIQEEWFWEFDNLGYNR
jgi:hypothetical protein